MRKFLVSVFVLLMCHLPLSPEAAPRSLESLRESVARVELVAPDGAPGNCSAVSLGPSQWLSEAHCDTGGSIAIGGHEAEVLREDRAVDLMLLKGPVAPGVEIATSEVVLGESVTFMGWPQGWFNDKPMLFYGKLSVEDVRLAIDGFPSHQMNLFHEGGGPGMSGGPIFNQAGQLVGLSEAVATHPSVVMASPTLKVLRKFLGLR